MVENLEDAPRTPSPVKQSSTSPGKQQKTTSPLSTDEASPSREATSPERSSSSRPRPEAGFYSQSGRNPNNSGGVTAVAGVRKLSHSELWEAFESSTPDHPRIDQAIEQIMKEKMSPWPIPSFYVNRVLLDMNLQTVHTNNIEARVKFYWETKKRGVVEKYKRDY